MEIIIHSRHLNATEAIKGYINKKASKLTKYSTKITKIQFTLKIEGVNNIVEAICSAAGTTLVAETSNTDMYAAIDLVMDKLDKQIIKQKEKQKQQPRRRIKEETPVEDDED